MRARLKLSAERSLRKALPWLTLACAVLGPCTEAAASAAPYKKVLILYSLRRDAAIPTETERILTRSLRDGLNGRLDDYSEHIDSARFADPGYALALRDFLGRKYAGQRFDLVITFLGVALDFMVRHGDELFPGTPVFFIAGRWLEAETRSLDQRFTGVWYQFDMRPSVEVALRLQPALRRIYVVAGASSLDRGYERGARQQFRQLEGRVAFTYLSGLTTERLKEAVAHLPANSAIYYLTTTADQAGNRLFALDVVDEIAAVANAPIYSCIDLAMDHGIVGGSLASVEALFRQAVPFALRVLRGEPPRDVPVTEVHPIVMMFDWRQLRRWRIPEDRLPPGSVVRFREPSVWERYRAQIITALSVLVLQTMLIVALLVQRARRRQAEETSKNLAGRLLTAQEAERRRIARDLHDDAGQRLASLSLALSSVKRQLTETTAGVKEDLTTAQEQAMSLSKDLRALSHELHPGILEHLGLVGALRSRCAEMGLESGIRIELDASEDIDDATPEAALCLYRVVQEALRNVVAHAQARNARVVLGRQDGHLVMNVVDDGCGFVPKAGSERPGLGLVSLDERVRMLGGTFLVRSAPRAGTTVSVRIPTGAGNGATESGAR